MNKKIVLIGLILVLLFNLISFSEIEEFKDIEKTDWFYSWVSIIKELDITSGYPDGTYKPNNKIKRIELLSFALKAMNENVEVSDNYWGDNILKRAVELELITNDPEDVIYNQPEGYITREETASVIYNVYLKKEKKYTNKEEVYVKGEIKDFADIATKYKEGIVGVYSSGIVVGYSDKTFKPNQTLTRAEASVFISKLLKKDKRTNIEIDLLTYTYGGHTKSEIPFTLYYNKSSEDLVNIIKIIDQVENSDTSSGFAQIYYDTMQNSIGAKWFDSAYLYERLSGLDLAKKMQWDISLELVKSDKKYVSDINIYGWRNNENSINREETLKAVFNYLFSDDSERIYELFIKYYYNKPELDWVEVDTVSFGRKVKITADKIGFHIQIEKLEYVEPIVIDKNKIIVKYPVTYSEDVKRVCNKNLSALIDESLDICVNDSKRLIEISEDLIILDVRTEEEFNSGHLKNAINLPYDELYLRIIEIKKMIKDENTKILVYCKSGGRSYISVNILKENNFNNIYHMYEGYEGYRKEILGEI